MYLNRLAWSCQGLDCLLISQEWSEFVNSAICNGNQVEHHRPPELNYFFGSKWPWSRCLAQCCCIIKLQGFNFLKWILVPIKSSGAEGLD